jgi:hypothetical protein
LTTKEPPMLRLVYLGTGGILNDPEHVARLRDERLQPSQDSTAETLVFDLDGAIHTPSGLQTLLLPLARRIRAGEYGATTLVIRTSDEGVATFISYLAQAHDLPVFLSGPTDDNDVPRPLGNLTLSDITSLETIHRLGGQVTVSQFANEAGLQPPAANNRLAGLAKRGYLFRFTRGRREGDLFVDPRHAK